MVAESQDSEESPDTAGPRVPSLPPAHTLSVWERLKAHKVAQWTLAYAAAAYTLLHGTQMMGESFEWPNLIIRIVTVLLILGVPLVATLAWFHGHRGRQRVSGPELVILTVLLAITGSLLWYVARHHQESAHDAASMVAATKPAEFNPPEHSIAVLPFSDMSEKRDQEYFADGMAEEILNLLVKIPNLKVTGRTSSFQFKGKAEDLRRIGVALNTTYVVEGSVRRSGNHVRVTAQLIDTLNGIHRWSETYDRDISDVFKVQSEIATSLVRALQLEVLPSILVKARSAPRSPEAYDSYLRGLHALNRYDQRGFEEAVAYFHRALELAPAFLPAAEGLALAQSDLAGWAYVPPQVGWEQTREACKAALRIDPNSAPAHAILGHVYLEYDWDWPAAQRELKTAVVLAPHDTDVLRMSAIERMAVGEYREALHLLDAAMAADPLVPVMHAIYSQLYLRLGRLQEAESEARRAVEISPTFAWGHAYLGMALTVAGKATEALVEMQKETDPGAKMWGLAIVYYALDRTKDADAVLARLEAEHPEGPMYIAEVHAFRGQKDRAFEWLDRAYAQKDSTLFGVKGEPFLESLESDPRYKAFLRKMKLPE